MAAAIDMKSCCLSAVIWTEATILVSESCQIWSSWTDSTPSTARMELLTESSEMFAGTACSRMKDVLRTRQIEKSQWESMVKSEGTHREASPRRR